MKSVVLIILDGWGLSPVVEGNATLSAKTPFLLNLMGSYPKTILSASGEEVGLPFGEMGNSEVGHLNLGTGRVVLQDLPRIDKTISDGSFYKNEALLSAIKYVRKNNSALHFLGLASAGGVHSHINHLFALLNFAAAQKLKRVYIHMITDGRDTPQKEALNYLHQIEKKIKEVKTGQIATICGRYYAMDRDKHWERTEKAYNLLIKGEGRQVNSPQEAIKKAYQEKESDEFISPIKITGTKNIAPNDALIFFNFRSDRARQISQKIISSVKNLFFVSFTSYGQEPTPLCRVAFFAEKIEGQLASVLAEKGLSQLHIAETEKYPHVTYFFNGGVEKPFSKEQRILIPSPRIATYDLKPEMSAKEITQKAIYYLGKYDFTVINFANADMVGHTGNFKATVHALETIDQCLEKLVKECFKYQKIVILTADHGNAEIMIDPETKEINKEHTTNPVFFILVDPAKKIADKTISKEEMIAFTTHPPAGILADVSPTILDIMEIEKPPLMTGLSLMESLI